MSLKRESISSATSTSGDLVIIASISEPNFIPDGFHFNEEGDAFVLTNKGKALSVQYSIAPENMDILRNLDQVLLVFTTPDDRLQEAMITRRGIAS